MLRKLFLALLLLSFLGLIALVGFCVWGYHYITRDLPKLSTIEDYKPAAVSKVYSSDGTLIAEFYRERRYPVALSEVPDIVRKCFLASEDANFYSHPGIDPLSIVRALVKNIESGEAKQGGSTITQQVVKNLLLSSEKKLTRKAKEAILSYRLEERLSKDNILQIYLNQIFFGNTAYGIKAAAQLYFHKQLKDLTLAEGAMLAGLPKAPTRFSPISSPDRAKKRQRYVLGQMVKAGFITEQEAAEALAEDLTVFPATSQNFYHAPYFVSEVRRELTEKWRHIDPDVEGLEIHTSLDLGADRLGQQALAKGLREVDKRRGWRGKLDISLDVFKQEATRIGSSALKPNEVYHAMVKQVSRATGIATMSVGDNEFPLNLRSATWARKKVDKNDQVTWIEPHLAIKAGDVIEVSFHLADGEELTNANLLKHAELDQTPDVEGALVLLDPNSGQVKTVIGGYSYQRSVFNRATQSYRQPGSAFKPILYLAAVDGFKYTPSTIVYDTPRTFRVGDEFWTPSNFDENYMGGITLRVALEKSRNLVSADIISRIGVDAVIQYAKKLGIRSRLGRNLSLALGSSEVPLLELSRAYGVFASKGVLFDSTFVTKISDRLGNTLYEAENDKLNRARQAINENSAFIMAHMMKGVVAHGTGFRVKELGRPVAGKTGTSNDEMDSWFLGYTPHWVCGVWVGFDVKKSIGEKETGGRVAAPIFLYFMRDFLKARDEEEYQKLVDETRAEAERLGIEFVAPQPLQPIDFSVPEGVDPFWVNKSTGYLSTPSDPGAIYEYFVKGTEPPAPAEDDVTTSYLESPEL